jgi:hypothetical protein
LSAEFINDVTFGVEYKISWSSRLRRGEHIELFEKLEVEVSNNANVSFSTTSKNESTEGSSCRVAELIPPQRSPCSLVYELFYDTLVIC